MAKEQLQFGGARRYRVRHYNDMVDGKPCGKITSDVVLAGEPPKVKDSKKLGTVYTWSSQKDSTINICGAEFIIEVTIEACDLKYGEWHRVGLWEPSQ